jgi:AcrR family transcriptional regulator
MPKSPGTKGRNGSRTLTTEAIVEMAVRICDTERIDSLTIRRLASELGVGPMTLYSYFRSKDEILDGVADHVLGSFQVPEVDGHDAAETIRALAHALLGMMRRHPSVVYLMASRTTTSAKSMKSAMDDVIGCLRTAGFGGDAAVRVYAALMIYALGFASYQLPRQWGLAGGEATELRRQRTHFYASLPRDEFPNLVELSPMVTTMASDEQFEFGLDALVAGLRSTVGGPLA